LLRLDYWQRLSQVGVRKIGKELKKRRLEPSSIEAFHLHLANGLATRWFEQNRESLAGPTVRVTTRANEVLILKGCRDADDSIGAHLEAIRNAAFVFLPLQDVRIIELGPLKRWMTAQAEFVDGARENLVVPLTYRDSMGQTARGVQEGVETITQPLGQSADLRQAFGQKRLQSETGQVAWSRILRLEIEAPTRLH
jgi:protein involved in temperature-dependent protein secretion